MRRRCLLVLVLLLSSLAHVPSARAAPHWARPVPGDVLRPFGFGADPFAAGQHRGADLAARAGQAVRAACAGRVLFAGRVAGEVGVVSVRCSRWRVSYVGLGGVAVRAGGSVRARERIGRAAGSSAGHAGLHLGVRREGERFGYVDPLRFLSAPPPVPPPLAPVPRRTPRLPMPAPALTVTTPVAAAPLAPWPVWAGLALVLAAVAGNGYARRSRSRQRRLRPCPVSSTSSSSPTTPTGR